MRVASRPALAAACRLLSPTSTHSSLSASQVGGRGKNAKKTRGPKEVWQEVWESEGGTSMAADCAPLRCLGFCGADDSVDPLLLSAISAQHPWVEWGVLFREDKAGQARYASAEWLQLLGRVNTGRSMRLAGHLCAGRADELLRGDTSFIKRMHDEVGFQRFQLNATAANACDVSVFTESADGAQRCVDALRAACAAVPEIELIIQRNTQTRPLWEPLLDNTPPNVRRPKTRARSPSGWWRVRRDDPTARVRRAPAPALPHTPTARPGLLSLRRLDGTGQGERAVALAAGLAPPIRLRRWPRRGQSRRGAAPDGHRRAGTLLLGRHGKARAAPPRSAAPQRRPSHAPPGSAARAGQLPGPPPVRAHLRSTDSDHATRRSQLAPLEAWRRPRRLRLQPGHRVRPHRTRAGAAAGGLRRRGRRGRGQGDPPPREGRLRRRPRNDCVGAAVVRAVCDRDARPASRGEGGGGPRDGRSRSRALPIGALQRPPTLYSGRAGVARVAARRVRAVVSWPHHRTLLARPRQ